MKSPEHFYDTLRARERLLESTSKEAEEDGVAIDEEHNRSSPHAKEALALRRVSNTMRPRVHC